MARSPLKLNVLPQVPNVEHRTRTPNTVSTEPTTQPSLLVRMRDPRDSAAWSQFVRLYMPLIYEYLRRRGLQDADAADVAQNVLRSVAGAMPGFAYDASRGTFRGWLLTVTRSQAAAWWDRQRRQPAAVGDSAVVDAADRQAIVHERQQWEDDYRQCLLAIAAERVRPQVQDATWQAFWKTSMEHRPIEAVAAELGMSIGAVYIARSRVIGRLRAAMAELERAET